MTLDDIYWIDLQSNTDSRGVLTAIEANKDIPFEIKRVFYMHNVLDDRAAHAHPDTDQVVIAAAGSFKMTASDGENKQSYEMNDPTRGLYVPHMVFIELTNFTPGAVCLVLANTHYEYAKVIRTWDEYLQQLYTQL